MEINILPILGYIAAAIVGISLGLIGGGGSILTVPILVYLLGVEPVLATAYSLFIVGLVALIGAIQNFRKQLIDVKTAVIFAIPAFIAVFAARRFILPNIPDVIFSASSFTLTKGIAVMIFFAIIMLLAAFSMINHSRSPELVVGNPRKYNYLWITLEGIGVGLLTGIVGAGGGFLIIPALVLLAKLPMKKAIGTSLLIIAAKSLIGFTGDLAAKQPIDWPFLMIFSGLAVAGIIAGTYLSNFISANSLKKFFGWFVLVMSIYILIKEIFF